MVSIEELKLGNETLEALNFLLSQTSDLEKAVSAISMSEIKDANTLTKEQIATLQDIKRVIESSNADFNTFLGGLGAHQTLQDLTAQRLGNTVYENTSDKPIYVSIMVKASRSGGTVAAQLFINDALASEAFSGNIRDVVPIASVCGIVPKGARYKAVLNDSIGPTLVHNWAELR